MILLWEQLTLEEQERVRAAERAIFKKPLDEAMRPKVFWQSADERAHEPRGHLSAEDVRAGRLADIAAWFRKEEAHAPTPAPVVAAPASEERTEGPPKDHVPAAGREPHVAAPFVPGGGDDAPKAWKPCARCGSLVGCGGC